MIHRFVSGSVSLGLALALGCLGGCHGDEPAAPIDGKQSTTTAAQDAEHAISQAGHALAFTMDSNGTLSKTADATGSSTSTVVSPDMMPVSSMPPSILKAMVGPALTAQVTGMTMPSMMTAEEKFDQIASQLRRLMEERLFVDSNLETNQNGAATYLLKPDPTCRPLPGDDAAPGTVPDVDEKCQTDLTKVEVRVTVTKDGDGARLRVVVGPQRLELAVFFIHSDLLAVEVNLPQTKAAVDYVNTTLGKNDSPSQSYDELTGKVRSSIQILGADKAAFGFSILEPLAVAQSGGARFTTAAADPLYRITGDGTTRTAELQVNLGPTESDGTWDPKGTGVANRDLRVIIGGLYGTYALDEAAKTVTLKDVGIGETKLVVRGSTIFDLNLNASSMRRFSGLVRVNPDDSAHIEIAPKFDLTLGFDYNAIASDLSSPPSAKVAHDTYGVALTGAGGTLAVDTIRSTSAFNGGLKVVAGLLTISAASAPAETVTVPAGKCLTSVTGGAPTGTNAVLGALQAVDCP